MCAFYYPYLNLENADRPKTVCILYSFTHIINLPGKNARRPRRHSSKHDLDILRLRTLQP